MRRIRRFEGKHGSDEPRAESGRRKSRLVAAFVAVAMTVGLAGAGVAAYGDHAGSVFLYGYCAPSNALANCGVALCEFKEAFSTEPSLAA